MRPGNKSLSSLIAGYKPAVTHRVHQIRGTPGMPVWQRNDYAQVIRDMDELSRIRTYIRNNPILWKRGAKNQTIK
jgi:putative transposase